MKSQKPTIKKEIKIRLLVLALVVILGGGALAFKSFGPTHLKGTMEATLVPHVSEVSGKLLELHAALGQSVEKGEILAVLDSASQEFAVKQLELDLEQAMLALGEAEGGSGTTAGNALLAAQASYNSALAAAREAQKDYQRGLLLYEEGALTKDALDKLKLTASTADNGALTAKAKLSDASGDYSAQYSQLSVAKLESQLSEARRQLDKYTIRAGCDGIVTSCSYTEGFLLAPGYDVVDIASQSERFLIAYVPVELLPDLDYGQVLTVRYDSSDYEGVLVYLDSRQQYTPKDMQSSADKSRKSVKIKVKMPESCPMKPGETASISF